MADPLGMIYRAGGNAGLGRVGDYVAPWGATRVGGGEGTEATGTTVSNFKDVLKAGVAEVNRAQQEATRAVEDLATGQRADVESVVLATQKADNAFRMLTALRNKMVEAYDEIKQMKV